MKNTPLAFMRTGDNKAIENRGVQLGLEWLASEGFQPKDVSDDHCGYDILVGRRRIEVKASTTARGWNEVDIRKSCRLNWHKLNQHVEIERRGLPFDEIIEITHVGSASPRIYRYPARIVRGRGEFHLRLMWHLQLPRDERERYRARTLSLASRRGPREMR